MSRLLPSAAVVCAIGATPFASALVACVGDDSTTPAPPQDAGATDATVQDAAADAADGDAAVPQLPVAVVRVANWSPDAPAVDFCFAPHGSGAYRGPLLAATQATALDGGAAPDGGAPALPFPAVSAYVYLAPGTYDVRAVVAGAADCATAIGVDLTKLPALGVDTFATIALVGAVSANGGDPHLQIVGFLDDAKASGAVALRFVNASPSLAKADLGTGTLATSFKPLVKGVAFGGTGTPTEAGAPDGSIIVDPNGYASTGALSSATLSVHGTGASADSFVARGISVAKGSVLTVAVIGAGAGALLSEAGTPAVQLLECVDNAATVGLLGSCSVLEP